MHSHRQLRAARVFIPTLFLLGLLVLVSSFSPVAHAAGIVVNSTADDTLVNLDANTTCDLREAITNANDGAATYPDCAAGTIGADTITFSVSGTITLVSTLPNINDELTIDGTGQTITVSGNNSVRVMIVNSGKKLTLNAITIAGGRASDFGGGIFNNGTLDITNSTVSNNSSNNGAGIAIGGGIFNNGTLTVTNSTFSGNSLTSADISGNGGGIYNNSTLTVTNSTFSGNTSNTGGGGIANGGTLTVTNSTFSGNSASGVSGGGGIYNFPGKTLTVTNSTFYNNQAPSGSGGGGIRNDGTANVTNSTFSGNGANVGGGISNTNAATTTLRNSIIANSTSGGDCYVQFSGLSADAFNLDTDGSCGGATTGAPNLAALANNGGPTETMKLQSPSDALNNGNNTVCGDAVGSPDFGAGGKDQRGVIRPQNTTCDVGAYELLYCSPGSYDSGTNSCTLAPPGYYVNVPGAIAPIACLPGSYQDLSGDISCKTADAGYYVPTAASTSQTACPTGSNSVLGAVVCFQTGPGFVVNDATDTDDTACDALPGDCTLREAINAANALSGADTITFDIPDDAGALCSADNICTITLSSLNYLSILDDLTIDGAANAAHITVSGDNFYRVIYVNNGKTLNLDALTIADGNCLACAGGGILNNVGTVNVTNSTFIGNFASPGGAIFNDSGTVNIANSTFTDNAGTSGGAVYNFSGRVNIANSTFSGNNAGNGGAIFIFDPSANVANITNITNSTFSGNYANNGGTIYNLYTLNLKNSIITNSLNGGDCDNSATITGSDNLIDDTTCGSSASFRLGAVTGFDTTLANKGGPTQTFKLNGDSNAIDAVPSGQCTYVSSGTNPLFSNAAAISSDQRGETRPQGLFCDVGAYELVYTGFQTGPNFVVNSAADTNDNSCDVLGQGIGNQDCTLREAINAANALAGADTITFEIPDDGAAPACSAANICTITLSVLGTLPAINDDVTIDGTANAADITVSGNDAVRVMSVNSGKTLTLESLAIVHGRCTGCDGGGVNNDGGTLNLVGGSIENNAATSGGGVYNSNGTVTVDATQFLNNDATFGGGLSNNGTTAQATIENTLFQYNDATVVGGALFNGRSANPGGTMDVTDTSILNNTAIFGGGGMQSQGGTTTFTNVTWQGNSTSDAAGYGGAFATVQAPGPLLTANFFNNTFTQNQAANAGAIFHGNGETSAFQTAVINLSNSTIANNTANGTGPQGVGGGIWNTSGTLNLYNTTVAGNNAATDGDGIENRRDPDSDPGVPAPATTLYNTLLVNDANGVNCHVVDGTLSANAFNMADDNTCNSATVSAQTNLQPLASNGGATQTMALAYNSAAIDAGDDAVCAASPVSALDQRGEARDDLNCDIGAFEFVDTDGDTVAKTNLADNTLYTFGPTLAGILSNGPYNFTLTFNRELSPPPNSPPAGALPIDWDATASEPQFSFIVMLCYDPNVFPVDPNTLHVWHYDTSLATPVWVDLGGVSDTTHPPYACVKALTPLTSLSPLALAPNAPTATDVNGIKGLVNKNGYAVLRWKTVNETQIAGFNIYRQGKQGEWKQINNKFRPAKHAGASLNDKYRFIDKKVQAGKTYRYKIEIVYLDGHSEWTNVIRVNVK